MLCLNCENDKFIEKKVPLEQIFNNQTFLVASLVCVCSTCGSNYLTDNQADKLKDIVMGEFLIQYIKRQCLRYKRHFCLGRGKSVRADGILCSGFYDPETKTLKVARKSLNFKTVLIHEYCHMLQHISNSKKWSNYYNSKAHELFLWLKGDKPLTRETAFNYFKILFDLEKDCERRTLNFIKKHKLYLNEKYYVKQANTYLLSYLVSFEFRKWYKKPPYDLDSLIDTMPEKLVSFTYKLSKKQKELYSQCY